MANSLALIKATTPVQRGFAPVKSRDPNVAAVYATTSGDIVYFDGRPLRFAQQFMTSCRTRYDVDLSDHRRSAEMRSTPLRTQDGHYFIATVTVAFRVHDPREVVRRGMQDAMPVIYSFLARTFQPIIEQFGIGQAGAAENAIRRAFAVEMPLPEGLTVFDLDLRLNPDEASSEYLRKRVAAARELDTDDDQHKVEVQRTLHGTQIAGITQTARLNAQEAERRALGDRPLTPEEMYRDYLSRYPESPEKATALFLEYQRTLYGQHTEHEERRTEFVKFMMQNGVVQPGMFQQFVEGAAQQLGVGGTAGAIGAGAASWHQAPVLPGPGTRPPEQPNGKPNPVVLEQTPGTREWTPAAGVQPVYVLVDESAEAAQCLEESAEGLRLLLDNLRRAPGIRLSVLGFADQVTPRMPMTAVDAHTQPPWLTTRGRTSFAATFEALYSRITPDVEGLKQQQLPVRRPLVFLLAASAPADEGVWRTPYDRLMDSATHRYAPKVVACGVGGAPERLIATIATQPEFGYIAAPGSDVRTGVEQYWQTLTRSLVAYNRSLVDGEVAELGFDLPPGFRIAGGAS